MELPINPLYNVFEKYAMSKIINPYRFAEGDGRPSKDNLVSYWAFEETSGTTVFDSYGSNNGITGALKNQTGKIGKCFDYTGAISSLTNFGDITELNSISEISVNSWLLMDINNNGMVCAKTNDPSATEGFLLYVRLESGNTIRWYLDTDDGATTCEWDYGDGYPIGWFMLTTTYDGANMKLYFNGELKQTIAHTGDLKVNTNNFIVGNYRTTSTATSWDGKIDELSIWGESLTSDNIEWLYNNGNGRSYSDL